MKRKDVKGQPGGRNGAQPGIAGRAPNRRDRGEANSLISWSLLYASGLLGRGFSLPRLPPGEGGVWGETPRCCPCWWSPIDLRDQQTIEFADPTQLSTTAKHPVVNPFLPLTGFLHGPSQNLNIRPSNLLTALTLRCQAFACALSFDHHHTLAFCVYAELREF